MKWHSLVVQGHLETYLVPRRFVARKKKQEDNRSGCHSNCIQPCRCRNEESAQVKIEWFEEDHEVCGNDFAAGIKRRAHNDREADGHSGLREDVQHNQEFIWKHFVSDNGSLRRFWSLEPGCYLLVVWTQYD